MSIRYLLLHAYGMGGTIRTVINQANAMAEFGHEVEIVSVVRRRDEPQFHIEPSVKLTALVDQRDGVRSDSLGRRVWRRVRGKIVPQGEFAAGYFTERVEKAVIDYVSSLDGGILVTTRPALNLIAARCAPESVVRVAQEHMNLAAYPETVRQEIARYYGKFDAIAVLTATNQREYQRLLPDTKIVRIPNAVDVVDGEPTRQENPVVIAAGRLVPQKGFDLLIQAFAQVVGRHPEWRLRIFGSGPRRDRLRGLIDEYGLSKHVSLRGRTNRLHEELAEASIYALSSRFEGLPMVMIEAMTHALPIAAFDCPTGPGDVLTHEVDGLVVPPKDVDALAAALDRLMSDRDLRVRLGTAAAITARGYGRGAVMPLWENLFTELSATKTPTTTPVILQKLAEKARGLPRLPS
ncbi:glycosyltransferase family 4 protein [Sphaerimonospora mesophila]|uniref:glycosyltransferase family 4 protein n=1 Tax=Sphaerimonospora mesophila TaxID=37483 RepID=UPI0009F9916B